MSENNGKVIVIVYDFETTGPDPDVDLPVQTAAIVGTGGIIMNALSNPGMLIQDEAVATHGVTQEMVKSMPHPKMVVGQLATYAKTVKDAGYTVIIAGQNHIRFDNPMAKRMGWYDIDSYLQIDTFRLARRTHPTVENHQLGTMYQLFSGNEMEDAHDAIADVRGVAYLINQFQQVYDMGLTDLAKYCETPQVMEYLPFSKKHKGKKFCDVPLGFIKYMLKNTSIGFDDMDFAESVKHHHRFLWEAHIEGKSK